MGPKKPPSKTGPPSKGKKPDSKKRKTAPSAPRRRAEEQQGREEEKEGEIDLSGAVSSISLPLQQLLLNIFKTALLPSSSTAAAASLHQTAAEDNESNDATTTTNPQEKSDLHTQIQTLKAHLYNRDFVSAFADASPELLRAYALRWSASRCLAYVGVFKAVVSALLNRQNSATGRGNDDDGGGGGGLGVLCIGGGAGAELVALAGVWRSFLDGEYDGDNANDGIEIEKLSLSADDPEDTPNTPNTPSADQSSKFLLPKLSITAVDIAAWSNVVDRLSETIHSPAVPAPKTYPSPLLGGKINNDDNKNNNDTPFIHVSFRQLDILSLSEADLSSLISAQNDSKRKLISLMFTLNELFSTSMPKTTQLLLRITDMTEPDTMLLIVDSPGSYSTLSLGGGNTTTTDESSAAAAAAAKQRQYPMKFLLEHTLLTVAEGKWEKILSQDSRWFRRDASKLTYSVNLEGGDGLVKLEDMRYQIHVYRRI